MLLLFSLAVGMLSVYGVPCAVTFYENPGCSGTAQTMQTDSFDLTIAGDIYRKMSFKATSSECWKVMLVGFKTWGGEMDGKTCYRDKCTPKRKNIEPNVCNEINAKIAVYVKLAKSDVYHTGEGVGTGGGNVHIWKKPGRKMMTQCEMNCSDGHDTLKGFNDCTANCDRYNGFMGRGYYGQSGGLGSRYSEVVASRGTCHDSCYSEPDFPAYNKCLGDCKNKRGRFRVPGRRNEQVVASRNYEEVAMSRNCENNCRFMADYASYSDCSRNCNGRRSYDAGVRSTFGRGNRNYEETASKPFWVQDVFLFAIIISAIASVAGLTYCLYEKKKKVKRVNTDGRDSEYTSITA